ncbi:hypothetical protein SAMN04487825_13115 [Prevotella sp. kh1p2]|nr:hypothetical protein SAMN04487825_13115 [Prevotella sp. kh1p2]SNU12541.1 hypothetical protein SAMN06298210_13114 [Prevotellaceae bacterium KH2P17]
MSKFTSAVLTNIKNIFKNFKILNINSIQTRTCQQLFCNKKYKKPKNRSYPSSLLTAIIKRLEPILQGP